MKRYSYGEYPVWQIKGSLMEADYCLWNIFWDSVINPGTQSSKQEEVLKEEGGSVEKEGWFQRWEWISTAVIWRDLMHDLNHNVLDSFPV